MSDVSQEAGRVHEGERLRRWRMVLGAADAEWESSERGGVQLSGHDKQMDAALSALYDAPAAGAGRRGGTRARDRAGSGAADQAAVHD